MTWPTGAVETRSHESNADVDNVGGTVIEAADQNWVYDLLERLQIKVGPDTDTSAATSVEGRLKALEEADPPLLNPMTTLGDLIRGAAAGAPERLGIGTTDQVLTVVAGVPAWADPTGGFADPLTTAGDLMIRSLTNVPARLAVGTAGQLLGVSGGLPAWTTANYVPSPGSPQQGDVLYYNGSTWTRLGPGTTGQFLKTLGASANPAWSNLPSSPPGSAIEAPVGSAQGDVLYFDGVDWVGLPAGTSGLFLKTNGAGANPAWAAPASGFANPMTTLSDLIYADTGGTPLRLPIGTTSQVLAVVGGAPAWLTLNPMTTQHDLIVGGSPSGGIAPMARLAKGSNGQVLSVVAGAVAWANNPAGFADPLTTRGDLIVRDATSTTRLPLGTVDYVLTSDGTDAVWAPATGGGGGGGSALSRTTSGLILWHDYATVADHALTTTADALGYAVRTTYDHGTWAFRNGLLVETSGANPADCSNLTISQGSPAVFQARFYTPSVGTTQGGPEFGIQSGVDTRRLWLVRNGDATLWDRVAGSWVGSGFAGSSPSGMIQGQWIAAKVAWTSTATFQAWVNRVSMFAPSSLAWAAGAGGFGLAAVSAANTVFKDYAIYTSMVLTVAGLSGTQAFRLLNAGGEILAASATQSSGTATIDLATVADYPVVGVIEVLTATGGSVVTGGRYPAEGYAGDICPGDTYTYAP